MYLQSNLNSKLLMSKVELPEDYRYLFQPDSKTCLAPACAFTPRFLSGTPHPTHRRSVGVGRAGLCGLAELEFCEAGV